MKESSPRPETSFEGPWTDTTQQDHDSMAAFLKDYLQTPIVQIPQYNSATELHFSGTNVDVNKKIAEGTGRILSIKRFSIQEDCQQIAVVFDGEGTGHNIDIYLRGKALQDFLKFHTEQAKQDQSA